MIAWIKLHKFTATKCYYECYEREKSHISTPSLKKSDSSNDYQKITVFNFCPPGTKVGFTGLAALIVRSVEHTKFLLFLKSFLFLFLWRKLSELLLRHTDLRLLKHKNDFRHHKNHFQQISPVDFKQSRQPRNKFFCLKIFRPNLFLILAEVILQQEKREKKREIYPKKYRRKRPYLHGVFERLVLI